MEAAVQEEVHHNHAAEVAHIADVENLNVDRAGGRHSLDDRSAIIMIEDFTVPTTGAWLSFFLLPFILAIAHHLLKLGGELLEERHGDRVTKSRSQGVDSGREGKGRSTGEEGNRNIMKLIELSGE